MSTGLACSTVTPMATLQVASCPTIAAQLWAAVANWRLVSETVSSLRKKTCGSPSEKRVCCPSVPLGRLSELSHQVLATIVHLCLKWGNISSSGQRGGQLPERLHSPNQGGHLDVKK